MKSEATLIANQIYDMLDAWRIATIIDQAKEFKKCYPFLAHDMVNTYRLSYCVSLSKLLDPAVQNSHKNLCFESEINSMKKGERKSKAQDLLATIRQKSVQYRIVRNEIASHSSRQVMRSRRTITTPTIEKTKLINAMVADLYELVFKSVFPSPPVQTLNDLSTLLEEVQPNKGAPADRPTAAQSVGG
ncbi:MAG: hypothetical protein ACRD22_02770 [Terriglobia bacterium]